ncbi:MAG: HIT family protein [Minisyncoccia bacterium]
MLHASGKDGQQSVFHFHFHLFPRFKNDKLDTWPKLPKMKIDPDELLERLRITKL